jgi:hypothetical protein
MLYVKKELVEIKDTRNEYEGRTFAVLELSPLYGFNASKGTG